MAFGNSKLDRFVVLVQTEALYQALKLRPSDLSPASITALAMEVPSQVLADDLQELAEQAVELVSWFFQGGPEPVWLPEDLVYEEVYEEIVEDDEGL